MYSIVPSFEGVLAERWARISTWRAGGWNNLANETNVSNASPPGSKSPGRVRHEGGSIWVFKGHAKFYFQIRAATVVSRS